MTIQTATFWIAASLSLLAMTSGVAVAAINIPFTINLSENVTVTGTPRIAVDVGGNPRFANYTSGTGTNALTFTLSPTIGDVDLDGVTLSSPIELNGGTIKDAAGNSATLTFTPPNTSGIKVNYPSLGMDFTNGTSGRYTLNGTVYSDISSFLTASGGTFARNSIATYYDSTGTLQTASADTPRFDYDPVTHQPKGILIEESRTNLIKNSYMQDWTGAYPNYWNNLGNNTTKVSGVFGTNAMRITGPFTNDGNRIYLPLQGTILPSTRYTVTVRVKLISGTGSLNIAIDSWASNAFSFNSSNMVNGQYVTLTQTSTSTAGTTTSGGIHTNNTNIVVDLDYIQFEQGSFPTSYIPTTTASVTRASDSFTLPSAPWSSTNGKEAVFAQLDAQIPQPSWASIFNPGLSYSGNRYLLLGSNGTMTGGQSGTNITTTAMASSFTSFKAGTSFTSTNTYTALNGSVATGPLVGSSSPATTGIGVGDVKYLNGHLQILKYYPLPLSSTQLQLLTQ